MKDYDRMDNAELKSEILRLKKERDAVILAHNYQLGEIQDIADFCGDSLELSLRAAGVENRTLVFAGVRFMAETAKILSPDKTVLLPAEASCDMAEMASGVALAEFKKQYPGAVTVCYVNSTADVKAECDWCVTSANALDIVASLPEERPVIFVPDRNLGGYCGEMTGRRMILWHGYCPVHQRLTPEMIEARRREFPDAEVLMHPEVPEATRRTADRMLSTGGILRYVRESAAKRFIIATEVGILHRLRDENPDKVFIPASEEMVCPGMKVLRLRDIAAALENMQIAVEIPESVRERAALPIERMLNFKKK